MIRTPQKPVREGWGAEKRAAAACVYLDGLPKEALSQDLPVDQVTWPEDLLGVAAGTTEGF